MMKTHRNIGFAAIAGLAFSCMLVQSAFAADGDIMSIERYTPSDSTDVYNGTLSYDNPLTVTNTVMFKFRLMNRTENDTFTSNQVYGAGSYINKWYQKYIGSGGTNEAARAEVSNPLYVGVWMGNRKKRAKVVGFSSVYDGSGNVIPYYTDMICSYQVEPGDFALPLRLAARSGTTPVAAGTDHSGSDYWMEDVPGSPYLEYWNIWQDKASTGAGKLNFWLAPAEWPTQHDYPGTRYPDVDMSQAGIYIKTVDFDSQNFDESNWRQIPDGSSDGTGTKPALPALSIPGGVAVDNGGTFYVWTEDESIAYMANGTETQYDFVNPSTGAVTKRWVSRITTKPGDTAVQFAIAAAVGASNKTTTVYLSETPTNIYESTVLITNFVSKQIVVGAPLKPAINVRLMAVGGESWGGTLTAQATASTTASVMLDVQLTRAYTNDMTVTVTPAMVDAASTSDPYSFIGLSSTQANNPAGKEITITIPAGETRAYGSASEAAKILYVYANRASSETSDYGKGIKFKASVADAAAQAFLTGENSDATLYIENGDGVPAISSVSVAPTTPVAGKSCNFAVKISDAYGELSGKYSVFVDGTEVPDLTPSGSGVLTVPYTYASDGNFSTKIYVRNQDGMESAEYTVSVTVKAAKKVKLTADRATRRYNEGDTAEITVEVPGGFDDADIGYVFLVPQNAASSNLVDCTAFEIGVPILRGEPGADNTIPITFLDGSPTTTVQYVCKICSNDDISSPGTTYDYTAGLLSLSISNVVPQVVEVSMSDTPVGNGATNSAAAAKGVIKTFKIEDIVEPSDLDLENGQFQTEWKFYENGAALFTTNVYGNPFNATVPYAFHNSGLNWVTVRMKDKDMKTREWSSLFTFYVNTLDEPTISLVSARGTTIYSETDTGSAAGKINVNLNIPPTEAITVKVDVERIGDDDGMLPVLSTYYVNIPQGGTEGSFYIKEMDGTDVASSDGFRFTVSVTNETTNVDGKKWSEYYGYDRDSFVITVDNVAPVIAGIPDTNAIPAAINVPQKIKWTVSDIIPDMTNGMVATWQVEGATYDVPVNATGKTFSDTFEATFTSAGNKTVTLTVTDKDGGYDIRRYYFYVEPSKEVLLYPHYPQPDPVSKLSGNYFSAAGLGAGRVWADGAFSTIADFRHTWTYAPEKSTATVYGYGYRAGEKDDGSLKPGSDYAVDMRGAFNTNGPSFYTYSDPRDSFFYCWLLNTADDTGNYTGAHLGAIKPAAGTNTTSLSQQAVGLPEYDKDAVMYASRLVEAIFSQEYLMTDNMGDINQDGIPDYYAAFVAWDGTSSSSGEGGSADASTRLFEIAGYTEEAAGDLKSLYKYNGDGDYLPSKTSGGGSLIPNISSEWSTYGQPFTAYLEIRGYGEGLNFREGNSPTQGRNSFGAWVSERDFTEAESNAWVEVYGSDPNWTPENRTDPSVDDTDGDDLPDGYEYYIWYHAYVGWMEDGKLKRLEGSRFRLKDIAAGETITPEEIATLFNPNVSAGDVSERDSDNDGLYDLEEFAIGTNPIHWDTDGDGISDYWEVMRGLNPLKAETNDETNPDGDYMAWADVGSDYGLVTFPDGRMYALPGNGEGVIDAETLSVSETGTNGVVAIPVYRYGNATSALVPTNRGVWASTVKSAMAGEERKAFSEYECTFKPLDTVVVDWSGVELSNLVVQVDQKLALVHEQVRAQYGFDPRTGWSANKEGYVSSRWDPAKNIPHAQNIGEAGLAVNTKAYSNLDEYLLLKYRYMTSGSSPDVSRSLAADSSDLASKSVSLGELFEKGTTNPNVRYADKTYGDYRKNSSDSEEGDSELVLFTDKAHGADTDGDGVPDGWELYVGFNPNNVLDVDRDMDGDSLSLASEFAGVDSCNTYSNSVSLVSKTNDEAEEEVATIYVNHPGNTVGWYNKFFPTDPWNGDTDGDNVRDDTEGGSWKNVIVYSRALAVLLGSSSTYSYSFVYGSPEDDGSLCIRGGGMNPCSVDTDFDLLPDSWEMSFAGLRFENGEPVDAGLSDAAITLIRRSDGFGDGVTYAPATNTASLALGMYITAGMDATFGQREDNRQFTGDAYTNPVFVDPRTGTVRDFDFDHDGLQNFQEYLVQALRHLRYDDSETPLMGRWMPDGSPATEKFLGFLPMNIMDGETFYSDAKGAGFLASGAWNFRELGYFARPPHEWDPTALRVRASSDYDETGYRVMLPPHGLSATGKRMDPFSYASTDPRHWDTDGDNMDDYYELFHGLNPLLGSVKDEADLSGDAIAKAYGTAVTFWCNAWTGWPLMPPAWLDDGVKYGAFDAMLYPWMLGTPEADADGDGIRNGEEALIVNMTSPQPYHTDPTPLWFTDSSAPNKASFTSQYYMRDKELLLYPWGWIASGQPGDGAVTDFLFSFEENEGYDTDGDWVADGDELLMTANAVSDPQKFSDPDRRQALWFPGDSEPSAAISRWSTGQRLNYQAYDLFRQFTVEAWILPEDVASNRRQTIIERAALYGASTLSNSIARVRANFRVGIDEDNRLYGCYDSSDAIDTGTGPGTATVTGLKLEEKEGQWLHVALTYDGVSLKLYMDGVLVGTTTTRIAPANGLLAFQQEAYPGIENFPVTGNGYSSVPCAVVLGASVLDRKGMELTDKTTFGSFDAYYKGYIDEVRIWDGARTMSGIVEDMSKRYAFADVADRRASIYSEWAAGATRNDNDGKATLPAELVMHYSFQTLPGAVDAADVAWEPSGFTKNVRNLGKIEGKNVPGDIYCGWWQGTPVHSTVYANYRLVPWIQNTVGHLPLMDGSAVDSQYWSAGFGGLTAAGEVGVDEIAFPNTANPYSYYWYTTERLYHKDRLQRLVYLEIADSSVLTNYNFELRTAIVGTSDLVPLGGAFAKRVDSTMGGDGYAGMWDRQGAADAWTSTGLDLNANGIPDWWETVAAAYGFQDGFGWNDRVTYDGRDMTVREAYLRDIQKGMLPDGTTPPADSPYRNVADTDKDGLPDWWEDLYGLSAEDGLADADNDGLSNYAEYLIGECFPNCSDMFPRVSPLLAQTLADAQGQTVPDYFLRVGLLYLGEMFSDHDFMEDAWEDQFDPDKVSRFAYDPWGDPDNDGWSNWAECRAATDPTKQHIQGIDMYSTKEFPVPEIRATVSCAGMLPLDAPIYIRAYSSGTENGIPDAIWTVGTGVASEHYIGINPQTRCEYIFGPGSIEHASFHLLFRSTGRIEDDSNSSSDSTGDTRAHWPNPWSLACNDKPEPTDPTTGHVLLRYSADASWDSAIEVGTIDYVSGKVVINWEKVNGLFVVTADNSSSSDKLDREEFKLEESFVIAQWQSVTPRGNTQATLHLSYPSRAAAGEPARLAMTESRGRVREGKNTLTAFLDLNSDGVWTPGEPYGVATDVDVGWSGTSVAIELTDTAPQMARINLRGAIAAQAFADANLMTDRGVLGNGTAPNVEVPAGTNMPQQTETSVRVRIALNAINGRGAYKASSTASTVYPGDVVFDQRLNLAANGMLTEKDLLATGALDLEWGTLGTQASNLGLALANVTRATYRVVIGDGAIASSVTNNNLPVAFVNEFEATRTACTPVSPQGSIYTQPTFTWRHDNSIGKAYPAFRLRVFTAATGGTLVYDSGNMRAPVRNLDGSYSWTAPIYPDMTTPQGQVFATTNNYFWTVSMLDAKFTAVENGSRQEFRLEASGELGKISDYGKIEAKIRYFGPATASAAAKTLKGMIRVQAFVSPDFTGMPAGECRVTDVSELADVGEIGVNATILGIKPGTYYLRAFIDTDGDGEWQRHESWGYGNYVGAWDAALQRVTRGTDVTTTYSSTSFPFTPRPYTVAKGEEPPVVEIYIEDTDQENDGLPDAWEWEKNSSLTTRSSPTGATFFTKVNTNLATTVASYTKLNAASSGQNHAVMTLMNTLMSGSDPDATAAAFVLLSGDADSETGIGQVSVKIDSFSLDAGISLTVTSDVDTSAGGAGGLFVVSDTAPVSVILVAAKSPDFSDARETTVKRITLRANADVTETVSAGEVQAAIEAAGLGDAAFFKVKLEQ